MSSYAAAVADLNTTGYAILCQLALRPCNTYELNRELQRNARYFAPRAESRIYTEVKSLERRGLVRAQAGATGRRPKLTYRLTSAGGLALEAWLRGPARPFSLECEAVLRLLVAARTTPETLLADLDTVIAQCNELLEGVRPAIAQEYAEGRAPFQADAHARALIFDFITSYHLALRDWAERSRAAVLRWPSTAPTPRTVEEGLETIAKAAERGAAGRRRSAGGG